MENKALPRREFLKIAAVTGVGLALDKEGFAHLLPPNELPVYVGTYTTGTKSEGIYLCRFNLSSGELKHVGTTKNVVDPSFVALSPNRRFLYAVNEVEEFGGKKSGAISAFAIDQRTNKLELLNQQPSLGGSPCYILVDQTGRFILVANYMGGNVAVLPIRKDGSLGEATDVKQGAGSSVNTERQEGPHGHCIELDKANRFAYECDLGTDKIMIFDFDARRGKLSPNRMPFAQVKPGAGPRHLAFHPSGKYTYVLNELHGTITAFNRDQIRGGLKEVQTVPTLPKDFTGENTSADIHVSPDGRFLYCSNRGHDSIAAFKIDPRNGRLTFIAHEPTGGKTPRNFAIDPTGAFLLAANQKSDNIVVFRLDKSSGRLSPTGNSVEVPAPVCLKFVSASTR